MLFSTTTHAPEDEAGDARPAALPLYLAFAGTGVGVALPGALLPALLLRWHLSDAQAGRLFLMAWIGSSLGAALVRGALCRLLVFGSLALAGAAAGLALCGAGRACAWMLVYGVGLGISMTAISLIRRQQTERAGAEMIRLNLVWAMGACLCPLLSVQALEAGAVRPLLFSVAGLFVLFASWVAVQTEVELVPVCVTAAPPTKHWLRALGALPAALIAMLMLITGIEAAAGGWLATYVRRGGDSVAGTIAASTAFWAGLLVSRLFWSTIEGRARVRIAQGSVVRGSIALMAGASLLLIRAPSPGMGVAAAFGIGFGIGPTYPLLLAWALDYERDGALFFLAGVGSALLPWLTGLVSGRSASLRTGLAVPVAGTLLMLALAVVSPLKRWSREPG